jgi:hypothetical protein
MSDSSDDYEEPNESKNIGAMTSANAAAAASSSSDQPHNKKSNFSLRFQKNIASKLSTRTVAKTLIDERTSRLLDNLHDLVKIYTNDKKQAHKFLNNIIKIVVKIEILIKNKQFTPKDKENYKLLSSQMHLFAQDGLLAYQKPATSLNVTHLHNLLIDAQKTVQAIVLNHLTEKSKTRIDSLFALCASENFLKDVYTQSKYEANTKSIASDVSFMLDNNLI